MFFEEFEVGRVWLIPEVHMSKEAILEFAEKYDPLPIHTDEKYAEGTRFGGLIASGPHSFMALWTQLVRTHNPLGDELVAGASNHMAWPAPTHAGDTLHGELEVLQATAKNDYNGVIKVELRGYNQHDELVVKGGAEIYMKRKSPLGKGC
ncbi:MAG TPA: hypothetical protein DEB24_05455 [Coriobacteriia bacterium]|nr:hypothetical protein [Coriobacteriia bacterium]